MNKLVLLFLFFGCIPSEAQNVNFTARPFKVGAERLETYIPTLDGKRVALLVNQSSMIGNTHLVDTLLSLDVNIKAIFSPEHGYRGTADAGAKIVDEVLNQIPVYSLYGKNRKPTSVQLNDIDIMIFDIQDVGTRFYTYISSMHLAMEACAENNKELLILDRPNPNGHYVDGPVLEPAYTSFVGMHPIPIVHGLTVGELSNMIIGEGWLQTKNKLSMTVVPCAGYDHNMIYDLPVKPSPNLPNRRSILLYPSLCLFEGTVMSVGRGTDRQFQIVGHPKTHHLPDTFTPVSRVGAQHPKWQNELCHGIDMSSISVDSLFEFKQEIDLELLLDIYSTYTNGAFFNENLFFDKLAGTSKLRESIEAGLSAKDIRKEWEPDLMGYKETRKKYLLYP